MLQELHSNVNEASESRAEVKGKEVEAVEATWQSSEAGISGLRRKSISLLTTIARSRRRRRRRLRGAYVEKSADEVVLLAFCSEEEGGKGTEKEN